MIIIAKSYVWSFAIRVCQSGGLPCSLHLKKLYVTYRTTYMKFSMFLCAKSWIQLSDFTLADLQSIIPQLIYHWWISLSVWLGHAGPERVQESGVQNKKQKNTEDLTDDLSWSWEVLPCFAMFCHMFCRKFSGHSCDAKGCHTPGRFLVVFLIAGRCFWPEILSRNTWAVAAKPLLVDDYRGFYYPVYWGLSSSKNGESRF